MTEDTNQVENLRDNLLPPPAAEDQTAPLMPFRTSYPISREEEDSLVTDTFKRIEQIARQMGQEAEDRGSGIGNAAGTTWDASGSKEGGGHNPESWLGKRQRFTNRYYSHLDDRKKINGGDNVFQESNLTAGLLVRIVRQTVARTVSFFFGQPDDTDWFSSEAVGAEDETIADKIKKHSRWKVDECGIKERFIEWIEFTRVRGEGVVKVTHQKRGQIYKRTATIFVVPPDAPEAQKARQAGMTPGDDGMVPMLDAHGDYIVQGDTFIDELAEMPASAPVAVPEIGNTGAVEAGVSPAPMPPTSPSNGAASPSMTSDAVPMLSGTAGDTPASTATGVAPNSALGNPQSALSVMPPPLVPTGRRVLRRDGVTLEPEAPVFREDIISRELITFKGPEAELVDFEDFLCPLNARDIQTADLIGHRYDMDLMKVVQMFRGQFGEGDAAIANMEAAVARLRDLTESTPQPKSGSSSPREGFKESNTDAAESNPACALVEVCRTYTNRAGETAELFMLLDRKNQKPIYYEYLANVTVRGKRPYVVGRVRAVDGRWYGVGDAEFLEQENEAIDLLVNRYNFNTSKSGRITLWDPSLTIEGDLEPDLKLNDGSTYRKKPGAKTEDVLSYVQLPNDSEKFEFMIQFFMQGGQLKSGVVNGADQEASGLPTPDTATGVNEIHDSGQELFSHTIATLFPGVKEALSQVIDVIYANMDKEEIFNFFNGDANEVIALTPEDTRDLAMNVTLSLSRTQQRKTLETGDRAQAIVDWFYGLAPMLQEKVATFARGRLKSLGVAQADKIIEPLDPALMPGIDPVTGQPLPQAPAANVTKMPTSAV